MTMRGISIIAGMALAVGLVSAATAGPAVPRFVEETVAAGIAHSYTGGRDFLVGGGVAVFDCDGDGRAEILLAGGEGPSAFYRNRSVIGGPLRFAPAPGLPGGLREVVGAYPIDIDGDAAIDLVVLRRGRNLLLAGDGACGFRVANAAWGFDGGARWTTSFSATWEPGATWPTLFIGNYIDRAAPGAPFGSCLPNELHRPAAGGRGFAEPLALMPGYCALSALFSDWSRKGPRDLRLSNDREYNLTGEEQLYRLTGEGARAFTRADGWQPLKIWGMGIASRDITGDGLPEYFLTSMGDHKLRGLGGAGGGGDPRPAYGDFALAMGVTAHIPPGGDGALRSTGWHAEFADVNNDGRADLFVAKGNVAVMKGFAIDDPNVLFLGTRAGPFVEVGAQAGVASPARGRGAALADFNLDGKLDLVVNNRDAPAQIWRNLGPGPSASEDHSAHWLQLRIREPGANRFAVGAWVELRTQGGVQTREITIGGGHAGGQLGWLHFGMGDAKAGEVRILWPDGQASPWYRVPADRFLDVAREGQRGAALLR